MKQSTQLFGPRTIAVSEVVALAGFILFLGLPDSMRSAGEVVMFLGALIVALLVVLRLRRTRQHWAVMAAALASALGLIGAVVYLNSLADEPTAIPVAGFGVLAVSVSGLLATSAVLVSGKRPRTPAT